MDIKNSRDKYSMTAGVKDIPMESVENSAAFLLSASLDYEFRTTVVKELHTAEDMISIGEWIKGAKAYYLQSYKDSGDIISPGFHSHSKETMLDFISILSPYVSNVSLRGVD
jgi:pyruvate formate lyase activating enzyme